MKILITGASGFIGQNLTLKLLELGYELVLLENQSSIKDVLELNIKNSSRLELLSRLEKQIVYLKMSEPAFSLKNSIKDLNIEGVIHLATMYRVEHQADEVVPMLNSNIVFGTQLLESLQSTKVKWFINVSTFWEHYQGASYNPVNLYAATKKAFSDILFFYSQVNPEIKFVTLKLNDSIGENDLRKKLPWLLKNAIISGELLSLSPGDQKMNILDIQDIIDGFVLLVNRISEDQKISEIINRNYFEYCLKSEVEYSLKEIVDIYQTVSQKKINVQWGGKPYRNREVMKAYCPDDILPGWQQKISFAESVKRFLKV